MSAQICKADTFAAPANSGFFLLLDGIKRLPHPDLVKVHVNLCSGESTLLTLEGAESTLEGVPVINYVFKDS